PCLPIAVYADKRKMTLSPERSSALPRIDASKSLFRAGFAHPQLARERRWSGRHCPVEHGIEDIEVAQASASALPQPCIAQRTRNQERHLRLPAPAVRTQSVAG